MLSKRMLHATLACLVALGSLGAEPGIARAEGARAVGPTPPRLAFVDGEVSFWRPGAEDWTAAKVNTPLAAGDSLYAGDGANLEVEIGPRAFARAGAGTKLDVASLETGYLQLEVTSGHAALDFERLPEGQRVEVDTPNGAFTIDRTGYYRVDIDDGTTFATRRGGPATVIPAGATEASDVKARQQVVLQGTEGAVASTAPAPDADAWDRWNEERTAQLSEPSRSARYVSPDVAGVDDLDRSGDWQDTSRYGHVWVPRDTPPDWAPYSTGRWAWDPYYGWTWIDDAAWGWAPYHYGRWVWTDGAWGWAPGPVVAAAVYAPALVAFFGPVGVSVNVGFGFPFVSWVALGFGEPVFPWWGPFGFIGRPFWCGWGGPRIVNNIVINNTRIVNARNVNIFQNANIRNGVVTVDRNQFGRGVVQSARLTTAQAQHLAPLHGQLGVRPVAASLAPTTARAQRPPDRVQGRQVVATRLPQDPGKRLQTAGLASSGSAKGAAPRIVQPTLARATDARLHMGRTTPPPPPASQRGPGSMVASTASRAPTPPRGLATGPSRAPTPPRGLATGPSRAPTPPRGLASGLAREPAPSHRFASGPSMGSRPASPSRPPFGRNSPMPHASRFDQPRASFQPHASFQPRSSFQPHAALGAPHAASSGNGAPRMPSRGSRHG